MFCNTCSYSFAYFYLLGKGGYVFGSVGLSVCLFVDNITQLEALRERRPPWPRQIITFILPTVKLLSLGGERLSTQKRFGSLPATRSGYATTIMVFFGSFTHLRIPRSPPKFNQFFIVLPRTPPKYFIPIHS